MTSDSSSHLQQAHSRACTRAIEQRRLVSSLFIIKYIYILKTRALVCLRLAQYVWWPSRVHPSSPRCSTDQAFFRCKMLPPRDRCQQAAAGLTTSSSLPYLLAHHPRHLPFAPSFTRLRYRFLRRVIPFTLHRCAVPQRGVHSVLSPHHHAQRSYTFVHHQAIITRCCRLAHLPSSPSSSKTQTTSLKSDYPALLIHEEEP